jgi:hypothetical protein
MLRTGLVSKEKSRETGRQERIAGSALGGAVVQHRLQGDTPLELAAIIEHFVFGS